MTDEGQLTDDTWATVDSNNNRIPRKLTLISSEQTPTKSTLDKSLADTDGPITNLVDDNSDDFNEDSEEQMSYPSAHDKYKLEGYPSISSLVTSSYLARVPNSSVGQQAIMEFTKSSGGIGGKQTMNRKSKDKPQKIKASSAFNQSSASLTENCRLSKSKNKNIVPGRGNHKSPSRPDQSRQLKRGSSTESQNRGRSRSRSLSQGKCFIQVEQRKNLGPVRKDESPYACNIVELPPSYKSKSKSQQKVFLTKREHKLLDDQILKIKKELSISAKEVAKDSHTQDDRPIENPSESFRSLELVDGLPFMTASIPLKSWPTFANLQFLKVQETQTQNEAQFREAALQVDSNTSFQSSSLETINVPSSNRSQTDEDVVKFQSLDKLANKLEQAVFSSSEACGVLIHTIFKDSLGNANATESVLQVPEFQEFLNSPNEIQSLEKASSLLRSTCRVIDDYIETVHAAGITFPDVTGFSQDSGRIVSVPSTKSTLTVIEPKISQTNVWNFVPPGTMGNFQLSLFRDPDSGDILQMITCKDQIFRTQYTTSEINSNRIRTIISANREQMGIPTFANVDRILDTIVRISSLASTRLTVAKCWISKCCKKMYKISKGFKKLKYSVRATKDKKLTLLAIRLKKLNIFAGIVYQMSSEMLSACKKLQSGIWKSMHVQDVLKFPRIPGFPNPKSNKDCQAPVGTQLPIHEAMMILAEGIKGVDFSEKTGKFSLESLECGVKSKPRYMQLISDYLEGIKALGDDRDIEYGSLLMTLLCSTEMISFYQDVMPTTDPYVRAAVITNLGKINAGKKELVTTVKRMQTESLILSVQTMKRIQDIGNRQNKVVSKSGILASRAAKLTDAKNSNM